MEEFLEMSGINKKKKLGNRINKAMIHCIYGHRVRTLRDLKRLIGKTGWVLSKSYPACRYANMGKKSVEYFNKTLEEYGIEPIGPLYTPRLKSKVIRKEFVGKIDFDMKIKDFLRIARMRFVRDRYSYRVYSHLNILAEKEYGLKTLRDLKKFVEDVGWIGEYMVEGETKWVPHFELCPTSGLTKRYVEYFNELLTDYGLEPFLPIYYGDSKK